jgi:hypothetical protein
MLMLFLMLMCTVSLTLHKTMDVVVHNQDPNIWLESPIYFCDGGTCYGYPVERTNIGIIMKIGFRFDPDQDEFGGILMYEVQRKSNVISSYEPNIETEVIEEASKMMRLLVAWKIEGPGEPKVNIVLIEYGNEPVLNEDKLAQLYGEVDDIPYNYYKGTWLMRDDTVLNASTEVHKEGLELKITISQGVRNPNAMKSMWIGSER